MTFSEAMELLSAGKVVTRMTWGKDSDIKLDGKVAKMNGNPWLIAPEDSIATDWSEVI